MTITAQDILATANDRAAAREQAAIARRTRKLSNADAQALYLKQKAALTKAVNTGDADKVILAVKKAVDEWNTLFAYGWPDDWSRWQRALDDVLPWHAHVSIDDL